MKASLLSLKAISPSLYRFTFAGQASCGFPSPGADYQQADLSLDDLVGIHSTSGVFLFRAWGDSLINAGIHDGDVLVVDKAAKAVRGNIVLAVIGTEFVVKRLEFDKSGKPLLVAENPSYPPITLGEEDVLEIWGVCLWVLHGLR